MSYRHTVVARDPNHLSNIIWIANDYLALHATGPFSVYAENGKAVIELNEAEDSFLLKLSTWSEVLDHDPAS